MKVKSLTIEFARNTVDFSQITEQLKLHVELDEDDKWTEVVDTLHQQYQNLKGDLIDKEAERLDRQIEEVRGINHSLDRDIIDTEQRLKELKEKRSFLF